MKFRAEVINHLLNGGQIIAQESAKDIGLNYILIRMPKGAWVEFDGSEFEYLECSNTPEMKIHEVGVMTYRNGHVREVKRRFFKSWSEDRYSVRRMKREQRKPLWDIIGESYENYISVGTDKKQVCKVNWGDGDFENAKLIAAAPEMFNRLKDVQEFLNLQEIEADEILKQIAGTINTALNGKRAHSPN